MAAFTMEGWRGRIGLITPAGGSATEEVFNKYRPEGVAVYTTRIPLFHISYEGISKMRGYADDAAVLLAKAARADIIIFSCTAGSFMDGAGYDLELIKKWEELTGKPVTTTTTCVLEAIKELNIKSLNIVTPYSEEVNKLERAYFEDSGIKVTSISGALLSHPPDMNTRPSSDYYRYALMSDTPEADATFLSCTGLRVTDIIDKLENDLKKPVLTSNQCGLWGTLKKLGVLEKTPGLGTLFNR